MARAPPPAMTYQLEPELLTRIRRYRIVVGIDLSEYADMVLEHALDQAARHSAPELHLLTVRERRKPSAEDVKQALWERVFPSLEAFNSHGSAWRARLHVRSGRPDEHIAMLAAEVRADLIVIGQFGLHDKGLPGRVLRNAGCPTLVVGMPETQDTRICPMCATVRENSDGEYWFCDEHGSYQRRIDPTVSPMTVWSGGRYQIERAA